MGFFKKAFRSVRKSFDKISSKAKGVIKSVSKNPLKVIAPVALGFAGTKVLPFLAKKLGKNAVPLLRKISSSPTVGALKNVKNLISEDSVSSFLQKQQSDLESSEFLPPSFTATHRPTIYPLNQEPKRTLTLRQFQPNPDYKPLGSGQGVFTNEAWKENKQKQKSNQSMFMMVVIALFGFMMLNKNSN